MALGDISKLTFQISLLHYYAVRVDPPIDDIPPPLADLLHLNEFAGFQLL